MESSTNKSKETPIHHGKSETVKGPSGSHIDQPHKENIPTVQDCYINRELSWLEFNLRVLQEAADHKVPLLERLKFLIIYESNLDEFFRVRAGILTHREKLTPDRRDPLSGWTASEQLDQIMVRLSIQQSLAEGIWKTLKEELKADGVDILDFKKISKVDELMCKKHFIGFRHLLSPRIIEQDKPLPFLWNHESYVIAFLGRSPEQMRIAVIPLFRFPAYTSFELDGRQKIVLTARLVRQFLPNLFKKEEIRESAVISVTRNADVFIEENADKEDFRELMTKMLKKRKREMPVRVRVFGKLSPASKSLLAKKLNIPEQRVISTSVPFDLSFRSAIRAKDSYKYEERRPAKNIGLKKGQYFDYLKDHDILLSYPFQSMLPFVEMLYEAVDDPDVISIKITLYRLSISSKVAAALAYAADMGKDVLCLLELRARFDEQSNIDYSEMLEDAGCRVIYGLPDQKVHSKLCLITRQSDGNLKHITQVGTGNYNEATSEQYTDLSLITSDEGAAKDAEMVFAALEAGEFPPVTENLWVAPLSFKTRLLEMMDREIAKGPEGRICFKINSMNNRDVMNKLIECSQAGVKVELFIRGICCLKPGIPGMTENITIKSVVGRWLEHSRIFSFGSGDDERMFIGSGDLLNRNLERRVEVFMEVRTEDTKEQIREILNAFRDDREKARIMQPDGSYVRPKNGKGTSSQERLYHYFYNHKVLIKTNKTEKENIAAEELPADNAEELLVDNTEITEPVAEGYESGSGLEANAGTKQNTDPTLELEQEQSPGMEDTPLEEAEQTPEVEDTPLVEAEQMPEVEDIPLEEPEQTSEMEEPPREEVEPELEQEQTPEVEDTPLEEAEPEPEQTPEMETASSEESEKKPSAAEEEDFFSPQKETPAAAVSQSAREEKKEKKGLFRRLFKRS